MLRHLATEVGDEWRRLAKSLGIRPVRQLAIIRSSNNAAVSEARRDAVYDMLTSWMKKMPRAANKVCNAHTPITASAGIDVAHAARLIVTRRVQRTSPVLHCSLTISVEKQRCRPTYG